MHILGVLSVLRGPIELILLAMSQASIHRHKFKVPATYYFDNVENPLFKVWPIFRGLSRQDLIFDGTRLIYNFLLFGGGGQNCFISG